jgi:glucose/arabinose dehydrogenase
VNRALLFVPVVSVVVSVVAACGDAPAPPAPSSSAPLSSAPLAASAPRTVEGPKPGSSVATAASAQEVVSHTSRPEKRPYSEELRAKLKLAEGFAISAFATELEHARMLAVAADGTVYVTRPKQGDVLALRDADGDGKAEKRVTAISGVKDVHGIALKGGDVWLASSKVLWRAKVRPDGTFDAPKELLADLPDGGQHPNRTLAFSPDGKLFVSVGSDCNACEETNPEHATMLVMNDDGKDRKAFATGLRNTIGFGWHPATKELWGMDHGSDDRGDDLPPEELNLLVEGKDYGWPWAFGDKQVDPIMKEPKEGTKKDRAAKSEPAVLAYQAHSAPIGMTFASGTMLPEAMRDDAFFVARGSWNRTPPTGYKVVRIEFDGGRPKGFHDVASGWLVEDGKAQFGRLAGIAMAKDGSILVSDDEGGVVYRIGSEDPTRL